MAVVPLVDVRWVVELVNEYADTPRAAAGEQARPYRDVELPVAVAGRPPQGRPLHPDRSRLVELANELHAVFASAHRGEPVAAALNAVLERTRPWPRAGRGTTVSTTVWTIDDDRDRAAPLAAAAALAVLHFQQRHGQQRLGLCAAARCADAFADTSPAGRRRFCSPTCLNRHKVAAHRSRLRP